VNKQEFSASSCRSNQGIPYSGVRNNKANAAAWGSSGSGGPADLQNAKNLFWRLSARDRLFLQKTILSVCYDIIIRMGPVYRTGGGVLRLSSVGPGSLLSIATGYGLDGSGIESRWGGARFSAPVQTDPWAHTASCTMSTGSFPGIKSGRGVTLTPHPLLVPLVMKE
jgi:hypothetical protein